MGARLRYFFSAQIVPTRPRPQPRAFGFKSNTKKVDSSTSALGAAAQAGCCCGEKVIVSVAVSALGAIVTMSTSAPVRCRVRAPHNSLSERQRLGQLLCRWCMLLTVRCGRICTLANNQWNLGNLGGRVQETPFYLAIISNGCKGILLLLDSKCTQCRGVGASWRYTQCCTCGEAKEVSCSKWRA